MPDIHHNPLSIWAYECDDNRPISDFEKRKEVDYIIRGYQENYKEALEAEQQAIQMAEMRATEFQDALNALHQEDWDALVEDAKDHGIWDPLTDPDHFGIKDAD